MNKLTVLDWVALVLLVVGGLNWGLSALGWNFVALLGEGLARIIYLVVGLAAVYVAVMMSKYSRR
ncbi:MAG TPA: DUF378 domain-containing protein [Candidatus Nanoarchaeia archaeon]|nr:DUF378 domain-containing protein [Candidatus Nanoarchaeia archaeon]